MAIKELSEEHDLMVESFDANQKQEEELMGMFSPELSSQKSKLTKSVSSATFNADESKATSVEQGEISQIRALLRDQLAGKLTNIVEENQARSKVRKIKRGKSKG